MSSADPRKAAIAWFVLLCSGDATEEDHLRWRSWMEGDARHAAAWQGLQAMRSTLKAVPGALAGPTLRRAASQRRGVLRAAAGVVLGTGALGVSWRFADGTADQRTSVGERRVLLLDDGSRLVMNTDTALDLHFDAHQRRIHLLAGEVWVETAHAAAGRPPELRPFRVSTPEGSVHALGTRFTVRSDRGRSQVTVLRDAVEVEIGDAAPRRLAAGRALDFDHRLIGADRPADEYAGAWEQGSLIVVDTSLGELVAELARYRRGRLVCDPAVAPLRVSGAFPLGDTDRALAVLARSLPVRVRRHTDYWVTVTSASSA